MQHSLQSKRRRKKKLKIKPFRSELEATSLRETRQNASTTGETSPSISVANPEIKPSAENRAKLFSSPDIISISKMATQISSQNKVKEEIREAIKEEQAERNYTIEEIKEAWLKFTEQKLIQNKQVQAVFAIAQLNLKTENELEIIVPSETQQMYFNDYRTDLGDFFRNEFAIKGLKMEVIIDRQGESKSGGIIVTDKDRFEAMRSKNPLIDELRKKFNLQVDF